MRPAEGRTTLSPPSPWKGEGYRALLRDPETPQPPPWGAQRLLGYEWLVQPVLDRHCVRCHDAKDPKGIVLTSTRAADGFLQSFHTIFPDTTGKDKKARPLVAVSNRFSGAGISQPNEFGSRKSRLIQVLLSDELHRKECKLGQDDWLALVTWVDANAPYYDTFFNRRPPGGGPPRRDILIQCPPPFPVAAATAAAAPNTTPERQGQEPR